jgi:hypothetical protein
MPDQTMNSFDHQKANFSPQAEESKEVNYPLQDASIS